jgi:hypothetical protein
MLSMSPLLYQGHTIMQCYIYMSRTHKNIILHIRGNTHHHRGNDRNEALVIFLDNSNIHHGLEANDNKSWL